MAEYLAPGVYIEETTFRARSIEGVSTSTAGFVGPTRYGPIRGEPEIVTSLPEFERVYGGLDRLVYGGLREHNYLAQAVRAFFDNGGRRLYVSRVYTPGSGAGPFAGHGRADNQGGGVDQGIPDQQTAVNTAFSFSVPGDAFVTPNGAPLTLSAANMPGWLSFDGTAFTGTPGNGDIGTTTVTVTATDGNGNSSTARFHLTVLSGNNNAPFVDQGIADRTVAPNAAINFTVPSDAFADVDSGDTLTLSATEDGSASLPGWLTFDASTGTFTGTAPATAQSVDIQVTATDQGGLTAQDVFTLSVAQPQDAADYGNSLVELIARYPGLAGNVQVTVTANAGPNALVSQGGGAQRLAQVVEFDTVLVIGSDSGNTGFYDVVRTAGGLELQRPGVANTLPLSQAQSVHVLSLDMTIRVPVDRPRQPRQQFGPPASYDGLAPSPRHASSMMDLFAETPSNRRNALTVPFFLRFAQDDPTGAMIAHNLLGADARQALIDDDPDPANRQRVYRLTGGNDGVVPQATAYEGSVDPTTREKSGLRAFEDLENISILAAPGYSFRYATVANDDARFATIQGHLISHCERMQYRVAVLDSRDGHTIGQVRDQRGRIDSDYAALYYPWVRILDPITGNEMALPPSGFVTGIYARNDVERGVHKAPANEVVNLAIGFEVMLNQGQQEVLNPDGVNCFRFFEGRGYRLWGARTISSDPEWKYVNVRRYFAYLERSIERGTQWVVFEPNSSELWSKVRRTVEDFLYNEWANRRLMGTKPELAYFVRCDRSTMTQNDIDNGRLVCLIGVAPIKPAEFVIFRIGQWTGDSQR
jgi:hypothetical protein